MFKMHGSYTFGLWYWGFLPFCIVGMLWSFAFFGWLMDGSMNYVFNDIFWETDPAYDRAVILLTPIPLIGGLMCLPYWIQEMAGQ